MFFHKNTKKIIFVQIWVKMIFIRKFSYFMQKSDKNKQDKQGSKVSIRFFSYHVFSYHDINNDIINWNI